MHQSLSTLALAAGLHLTAFAASAQPLDGHMAGPDSEGPTNGHAAGPGMDVPTNGAAPPRVEGVESEAGPQAPLAEAAPAACEIAGQWRMDTANVGQSTWTFTPSGGGRYAGQEQGLGNATGEAVTNGNAMRLEWRTGGYSGVVELTIDPSCGFAQGQQVFYTGRTGAEPTRWTRVDPPPPPETRAETTSPETGAGAPSPIRLQGVIGGTQYTAELTRTGHAAWEWLENNARFQFRSLLDSADKLIIYDRSRDMFHRLNFKSGETAWRTGKQGGGDGNWTPHYTIVRQ